MPSPRPSPPYCIQIVADTHLEYFRHVVLGARGFGFQSHRLTFADRWLPHELRGNLDRLVRRDGVQGILAAIHSEREERRFAALSVPVVNVSNALFSPVIPVVTQDDEAVGRLAATHLLGCGCQRFAFCGQQRASHSSQRLAGFRQTLGRSTALDILELPHGNATRQVHLQLRRWLKTLPTPVGIFAVLDTYGVLIIRCARELGLRVPDDIAVIGAGDDDFYVDFESVPLSSIRLPSARIGYAAAAALHDLLGRRKKMPLVQRLEVQDISMRRSSDIRYVEDAAIGKALHYIREHAAENPYVPEVARHAGISRTALQQRFRTTLGRSVLQEVTRVKLGMSQVLLSRTDLPLGEIATRCGFPNSQRFSVVFRRAFARTPSSYRRASGARR